LGRERERGREGGREGRTEVEAGFTNSVHFIEIRWIRSGLNFKITKLLFIISKNKKSEKIGKKLDEILRLLVKDFFQIGIVCLVKI
jgi:hypothetical protein